ncbi:MAG TPA: hypothetical protein VFM14_01170 [Gemmatimonadales bacterium]|nr:hypothetical protein [Gemmatimonadales bacterium]
MHTISRCTAGVALATIVSLVACSDRSSTPSGPDLAPASNGFPQGSHDYRVNIIGVPNDKTADMDNNNGRRIFVQLNSTNEVTSPGGKNNQLAKGGGNDQNHIYLCNSTNGENDVNDVRCDQWRATHTGSFGVIDANATDGDGAILAVPDPCADALPTTPCTPSYQIFARAHGPGGSATITTCAEEAGFVDLTDDVWCGSNGITLTAKGNARKAIEITENLLHLTITVDGTTDPGLAACLGTSTTGTQTVNVYLFDNCFENYFWNYDNNGLKLLEVRFYHAA